jgi:uncharacterized protein involved in exopolysaccharide biosynthesis
MVGTKSEKRRWLGALTARPKLSIAFALVAFLILVAGVKVTTPLPQATAVVEIRANPLHEPIAALDIGLVPGSIPIGREAERLRSVEMVRAVLARLPEEEVTAIGTENGPLKPTWLADRLAVFCSRENASAALARLLCAVVLAGDTRASADLATIREALEITADEERGQISISFSAADPDHAATMANLFAETYAQQRQLDKHRLRQQVVDWITERQQTIDLVIKRAVGADAAGTTVVANGAVPTPHADPPTKAARSRPSGATSQPLDVDPGRAIAEQLRAAQDEFLRQTTLLLTSTAWAEPAAVVRSAASPPARTALLAGGLALMLAVSVSLILGVALGTLVDIVWPASERRPSFYDDPYWPQSGDGVTPRRGPDAH